MKAILMKVNYDRKYVEPHKGYEPLQTRINLTREIYHTQNKDKKLLKESLEEAAKRKLRQHEQNRLLKHSSPSADKLLERYKRKSAESLRATPNSRVSQSTLVSGTRDDTPVKSDKAPEGVFLKDSVVLSRTPQNVRLQPLPNLPSPNKSFPRNGTNQGSENSTPVNETARKWFLPRLDTSLAVGSAKSSSCKTSKSQPVAVVPHLKPQVNSIKRPVIRRQTTFYKYGAGPLPDRVKKAYSNINSAHNGYSVYKSVQNRLPKTATGVEASAAKGKELASASMDSFNEYLAPGNLQHAWKNQLSDTFQNKTRSFALDNESPRFPSIWAIPRPVKQKTSILPQHTNRGVRRDSLTSFILARPNSGVNNIKGNKLDGPSANDDDRPCSPDNESDSDVNGGLYSSSFESTDTSDISDKQVQIENKVIKRNTKVVVDTKESDMSAAKDFNQSERNDGVNFLEDQAAPSIANMINAASIEKLDKSQNYFGDVFENKDKSSKLELKLEKNNNTITPKISENKQSDIGKKYENKKSEVKKTVEKKTNHQNNSKKKEKNKNKLVSVEEMKAKVKVSTMKTGSTFPSLLDTPVHIIHPYSASRTIDLGNILSAIHRTPSMGRVSLSTDVAIPYGRSRTLAPTEMSYSRVAKTAATLEMERRARVDAERAMKQRKVFTIIGPYHSLRLALRRRGWVEKFVNAPMPGELTAIIRKKKSDDDNDDDGTANMKVKPWEEEGGLYGMMSHVVRNCIPTFVFTIKSVDVDSRIMKSGQLVNHYGKAKHITTKSGLCQNLRNVLWYDKTDPDTFYPRCYKMDEQDEKEAFIADYRLSACVGFVKHFIERYKYQLSDFGGDLDETCNKENQPNTAHEVKASSAMKRESTSNSRDPLIERKDIDSSLRKGNDAVRSDSIAKLSMSHSSGDGAAVSTNPLDSNGPDGQVTLSVKNLPPVFVQKRLKKGGQVPGRALEVACEQCLNYIRSREHEDIDLPTEKDHLNEGQWDQFLVWYYQFVHDGGDVKGTPNDYTECKAILEKYETHHLQYNMDGFRNIWIIKPGAKSRGRGIELGDKLGQCLNLVEKDSSAVIQKYIERPLLVHNTKFDIRQWFLVTDWNPLTVWFYKECYLRFCSQQFTNDDFHVSIHLANNSVQKNFQNGPRSGKLPDDNMWTSDEFQDYLRQIGDGNVWHESIVPAMKKAIMCSLLCSQEHIECRKSAFELYGADFMIGENMEVWLLEINSSPSMARNTRATIKLVNEVLEDTCKVVLDRKENKNADTGAFDLIYQQKYVNDPPPVDLSLAVTGRKIRKKDKYGVKR